MSFEEFVKNRCSKCTNRENDKDLCHIVRIRSGELKCHNEMTEDKEMVEIGKKEN